MDEPFNRDAFLIDMFKEKLLVSLSYILSASELLRYKQTDATNDKVFTKSKAFALNSMEVWKWSDLQKGESIDNNHATP